jgi:hypothetical protein
MRVVDLDERPHFTALSYVWGSPGSDTIICQDILVPVTPNCYSALLHLRKKLGAYCIWVDAICIDQSNLKEREQQVTLMGEIYKGAEKVFIWLGPGNTARERAMEYLSHGGLMKYFTGDNSSVEERFRIPQRWRLQLDHLRLRWSSTKTLVPAQSGRSGR